MPGKRVRFALIGVLAIIGMLALQLEGRVEGQRLAPGTDSAPPGAAEARVHAAFGSLPLYFIENQGQVDAGVAYYMQGRDTTVYFAPDGLTMALTGPAPSPASVASRRRALVRPVGLRAPDPEAARQGWAVKLDFVGANQKARPRGQEPTPATFSFFKGPREQWKTGLRTYASLVYADLWPGIDLVFTGSASRLKYTFLVHPGADPDRIKLAYQGATAVTLTSGGELDVSTPVGGFRDAKPEAYQEVNGGRREVTAAYALAGEAAGGVQGYSFKLGPYDRSKLLVLDPAILVYAGYVGASGFDAGFGIAVDRLGNAYVTGGTNFSGLPVPVNSPLTFQGGFDAFVAKVNAGGTGLVYAAYIGGAGEDEGNGIAVDAAGNAYITGFTDSENFPVTPGLGGTLQGGGDAFVAKVNATGTGLVYARYLGGTGGDEGNGIAVDGAGSAYVTGLTDSPDLPVAAVSDLTFNGGLDAFLAKVDPQGRELVYVGYIGGARDDEGWGIAVDGSGNAYIAGSTTSSDLPLPAGSTLTFKGAFDAFVARVNAGGTGLDYAGYIGGTGDDGAFGIAVDGAQNAYVTGETARSTTSFPGTIGPDRTFNGGPFDAFVAKVNPAGTGLVYGGFLGGAGDDAGFGIAVDGARNAYVTGLTNSRNFPTTNGPDPTFNAGAFDAFVAKVNSLGTRLDYAGYVGGARNDQGWGIAVDGGGNAYIAGFTDSPNLPVPTGRGPDRSFNGGSGDAFVTRVLPATTPRCRVTGVGQITAANGDVAVFSGDVRSNSAGVVQGTEAYQDRGPAQPLAVRSRNVLAIVCAGLTQASISGEATIVGRAGSFLYQIDVMDRPGADTYRIRLDDFYDSGERPLRAGNVQIRPN